MDHLTGIRAFCAVAQLQRFRAAAAKLGLSPAMTSKHVADLEARLGARLLTRNSRHVSLTEEGRAYFLQASRLLADLDELEASVSRRSGRIAGVIRLSAPGWMANDAFAALLAAFRQEHPEVLFELDFSARRVNLIEENFDLALRVSQALDPGLIAKPLYDITFHMCASPAYLARRGTPRTIEDFAGHAHLVYPGFPNPFAFLPAAQAKRAPALTPAIVCENEIFLRKAALEGMGVVVMPRWLVADDLDSGALVELLPEERLPAVKLHGVYSDRRLMPARLRVFLDFLARNAPGGPAARSAAR